MITLEYLLKKQAQRKQRSKFTHKTRYGRELPERWGYDWKGHAEEYQRLKQNPKNLFRVLFKK